jgi:hypothetical protein
VYVRSQGQWRLGTLTVARDSLRFTSSGAAPLGFVELLLGCADVARGRVLCSAEADHDPGVFEVEVLPSVRGATATAVRELSVRASRDGRGECVWFKVGDMARATEWAEAVDDASQAAGDAAAGLIWDWFRVPGPGAGPAVLAFSSTSMPGSTLNSSPASFVPASKSRKLFAGEPRAPTANHRLASTLSDSSTKSSSSSSSHQRGRSRSLLPSVDAANTTAARTGPRPPSPRLPPTNEGTRPPSVQHREPALSTVRPLELIIVREYAAVARARRAKACEAAAMHEAGASRPRRQQRPPGGSATKGPRE